MFVSCSSELERYKSLETALEESINSEGYELISLSSSDTVLKSSFQHDLQLAINEWNETNRDQFLTDFEAAYAHFSQDHVQHLHEQRLDIQNLNDSITLIHEHANSFVHEQAIKGLYLNQLSTLLVTLSEVDTISSEVIWFTIHHSYELEGSASPGNEKLFYFPSDHSFLTFDPSLDPIGIYNLHKFKQKLN
jgi:hypothetical protein